MEPPGVDGFIIGPAAHWGNRGLCLIPAAAPGLKHCISAMFLPSPFCLLPAAKIAGLQATVLLLLTALIKARIQIKAASALGLSLLALQTLVFLAAAAPWA